MGCGESRPAAGGSLKDATNYHTLSTAFIKGKGGELPSLNPSDQLETLFKLSLPDSQYGSWDQKKIELDDNLNLVESDANVKSFAESAQKQILRGLQLQGVVLQKAKGITLDEKTQYIGSKYKAGEAIDQMDEVSKEISKRIKKKGEQQKDEDNNGIKNFPKLCVKLMLEKPYLSDMIKANQLQSELDPDNFESSGAQNLLFGAFSSMTAKVVSKAQAKTDQIDGYNLPQAVMYVAGRLGEENFKSIMDMVEAYKGVKEQSNSERVEVAKKTVMIFPGVTQAFISKDKALDYLKKDDGSQTEKLFRVLFKVAVDLQGNMRPMDVKKFLGDDPAAKAEDMRDGLFQRLMVQVQSYSIEGPTGEDIDPETVLGEMKKSKDPTKVPDIYTMLHIIHVRQLENENDPNKSSNILDYSKKDKWESFLEKEAKKTVAEATP
uniref:Uncharacterized protein n=1 Tax=Strombidium rassoulzadegani TaxID=1082188 RepID=A0A7S3CJF5_9SPIT|mmetsp:Transcript_13181/g.22345  ORF Transcript_13181/g.22345 Transcript_13181/m.22345 type:complete len:435 (+) Transcript_13181:16-1320(+)